MQRSNFARYASLPLRLLVGYGFIEHGFAKLSRGPDAFASILQQLGVSLPHLAAWLTISTEIVGGLAMLLGVLVFWASIPMAVVLLINWAAFLCLAGLVCWTRYRLEIVKREVDEAQALESLMEPSR